MPPTPVLVVVVVVLPPAPPVPEVVVVVVELVVAPPMPLPVVVVAPPMPLPVVVLAPPVPPPAEPLLVEPGPVLLGLEPVLVVAVDEEAPPVPPVVGDRPSVEREQAAMAIAGTAKKHAVRSKFMLGIVRRDRGNVTPVALGSAARPCKVP